MATLLPTFLVLSYLMFHTSTGAPSCQESHCPGAGFPEIRFPFRLNESQPIRCGYPGFDLACNKNNQTILSMPTSGEFAVRSINYWEGVVKVNDPENCMPRRFLHNFTVDSPYKIYDYNYLRSYTYLNCTTNTTYSFFKPYPCLSGNNYTVGSVLTVDYVHLPTCRVISTVMVPMMSTAGLGLYADVTLTWSDPDCHVCLRNGGSCGLKGNSGTVIKCSLPGSPKKGLSKSVKYGISIGFGVFASIILSGFALHFSGRNGPSTNTNASIVPQTNPAIVTTGMSKSAIELYPKHVVGEADNNQLMPKCSESSCSICLCEYKTKEEVRVIPDCGHYFHVNCIDGWLERNATCPLCRKSPGGPLSMVSHSSSSSSTMAQS